MVDKDDISYRWRRAGEGDLFFYCENIEEKEIYYAREYTSGGGFNYSETNKLISNLKISPNQTHRLHWKAEAIQKFAFEASSFLNRLLRHDSRGILIPVPPSAAESDQRHDDRMARVASLTKERCEKIKVEMLLERKSSREPKHKSEERRSAEEEQKTLGLSARASKYTHDPEDVLIIFDDVTTGGGTFEAARLHLSEKYPKARIIGVMWAKAKLMEFS